MNIVKDFLKIIFAVLLQYNFFVSASSQEACSQIAPVIFSQHLAKANISASSKAQLQQILNNLYLGYLVRQNGAEVFSRSGNDPKMVDSYWQALKNGTTNYDTNPFCLYTALKQNPKDIQDNKICIDTASLQSQSVNVAYCQQNLKNMYEACGAYQLILQDFLEQINSKTFTPITGTDGKYQTNYVTFHLQKAIARLAATSSVVCSGMNCASTFTGDVRDRGIIVNIQNNTQKDFAIIQSTIDGKEAKEIGMIKPGLNNVNLHLASLQASNATPATPSAYKFEVVAMTNNVSTNEQFSIKIMSGTELLAFLKSINKNTKGLFYMNGRLIAPKYALYPEGQFLVLIKTPKNKTTSVMAYDKTADQSFPVDQRIQCIALNDSNPYFMTMQINEDEVEFEATKDAKEKSKATILQPSFFSMQSLPGLAPVTPTSANTPKQPQANPANTTSGQPTLTNALPPVILPDFLNDNPSLNVYTTILQTAYIASLTDFAFFNQKCFANDMMCYDLLGYFDKKNQRRVVLNLFHMFISIKELNEISGIVEGAIFETSINTYIDVPNLYLLLGSEGKLTANEVDMLYNNLHFIINKVVDDSFLNYKSFGNTYKLPFQNDLFFKVSNVSLSENIFVYVRETLRNSYEFIIKDKDDKILEKSFIYLSEPINNIKCEFLNCDKNWAGTNVPQNLLNLKTEYFAKFKLNYTYNSKTKISYLNSSVLRPIDKIKVIHTVKFSQYPIKEMYLDLYNTYEVSTVYVCKLIENGILPDFLTALTESDLIEGIYMVTEVKNNELLNKKNLGSLVVTFYQSDGNTLLGQMTIQGKNETTGKNGISEPVHAYNLKGSSFIEEFYIFLTTGILLKYQPSKNA